MKLVEIAARKISQWGDWEYIWQSASSWIYSENTDRIVLSEYLADDFYEETITRAQWEAERARIAAQSVSMPDEDVAFVKSDFYREMVDWKMAQELTPIACGKRSKEDQALWDKVAIAAINACADEFGCRNPKHIATLSFDMADAFMAERAKRMKG